jgi:hypothetical protein
MMTRIIGINIQNILPMGSMIGNHMIMAVAITMKITVTSEKNMITEVNIHTTPKIPCIIAIEDQSTCINVEITIEEDVEEENEATEEVKSWTKVVITKLQSQELIVMQTQ